MCGLFGFLGQSDEHTKRILHLLAFFNEVRGKDSSGLMLYQDVDRRVETDYGGFLFKDVLVGSELFHAYGVKNHVRDNIRTVAIGHTRAGTRGAKTKPNAHPYQEGPFVFAHNGMIGNFDHLQSIYKTNYEVDSQIIGYLLNNYESLHKIFGKKLSGSYAVPFINLHRPFDLNIMVNTSPMSIAFSKDGSQMYFSSLSDHLEDALLLESVIDNFDIKKLEDEHLYKFFIQKDGLYEVKEKVKMKHRTYSGYKGGSYNSGYNSNAAGSFYGKRRGDGTTGKTSRNTFAGVGDSDSYGPYGNGYPGAGIHGRDWDDDNYLSGYDVEKSKDDDYYVAKTKEPKIHQTPLADPIKDQAIITSTTDNSKGEIITTMPKGD